MTELKIKQIRIMESPAMGKRAFFWGPKAHRWLPMKINEAELLISTDSVSIIYGPNPFAYNVHFDESKAYETPNGNRISFTYQVEA